MIPIRRLTAADLPLGMRLKEQAGWNQIEADWQRMLSLEPDGCFVAEREGIPVGTVTTTRFGLVAWVAMMLVDVRYRGQGIGRALMEWALGYLDQQGVVSVRLDATPLGQPLYEKLGFVADYQLDRFAGIPTPPVSSSTSELSVCSGEPSDFESILALDYAVTGTDRCTFLQQLFREFPERLRVLRKGPLLGYSISRPGALAWYIGPCLAQQVEVGEALLADAWQRFAGLSVFVDIPCKHERAVACALASGLKPCRSLLRMTRGTRVEEDFTQLWASSGPELG